MDSNREEPTRTWLRLIEAGQDVTDALAGALQSRGTAQSYLAVLRNAFEKLTQWGRARTAPGSLAAAEAVAQRVLQLAETCRAQGWELSASTIASSVVRFYAMEGLMTEACRARDLLGLPDEWDEWFTARLSAWESEG